MTIKIVRDRAISTPEADFYTVYFEAEVAFECLSKEEVRELTIADIVDASM